MGGKVSSLSLNLVVHETRKQVLLAEANRDFVDVLLSSLITPVGAAVKVAKTDSGLGCMDTLFKSVADLDVKSFNTKECQQMLLHPTSAFGADCSNLVEHIDPTSLIHCYSCGNWRNHRSWSAVRGAKCPKCGQNMDYPHSNLLYADGNPSDVGVFLKGNDKYLITDDLKVSVFNSKTIGQIMNPGLYSFNRLKEKKVDFGREELLTLFRNALISKTPLSDTFVKAEQIDEDTNGIKLEMASSVKQPSNTDAAKKMTIDLVYSKSTGKFLYAEAKENVVNFFCSFLTFPLGLICNLFYGSPLLGCIGRLWNSARNLSLEGQLRTTEHTDMLLRPKLAPYHSFENQILKIEEGEREMTRCEIVLDAINPKSASSSQENGEGFLKGPATFMISDDLNIKMASISESLSVIRDSNGIDAVTVTVGELEALKLLKASLRSRTPLTTVFGKQYPFNKTAGTSNPEILNQKLRHNKNPYITGSYLRS